MTAHEHSRATRGGGTLTYNIRLLYRDSRRRALYKIPGMPE